LAPLHKKRVSAGHISKRSNPSLGKKTLHAEKRKAKKKNLGKKNGGKERKEVGE